MKVRAALAAADAGEGGDGIPVAVAVAGRKEAHVTFGAHLPSPCQLLLDKCVMPQLDLRIGLGEHYVKDKFCVTHILS